MAKLHISLAAERCAGGQMRSVFFAVAQPLPSIIPANYRFFRKLYTQRLRGRQNGGDGPTSQHADAGREAGGDAMRTLHNQPFLVDLISYGTTILPNTSGYHEIEFETWSLKGNVTQETLGFFLGSKPLMNTSDPVSSDLDNRKQIISKPGPTVHLNVEVILRNFTFHSLSGAKGREDNN